MPYSPSSRARVFERTEWARQALVSEKREGDAPGAREARTVITSRQSSLRVVLRAKMGNWLDVVSPPLVSPASSSGAEASETASEGMLDIDLALAFAFARAELRVTGLVRGWAEGVVLFLRLPLALWFPSDPLEGGASPRRCRILDNCNWVLTSAGSKSGASASLKESPKSRLSDGDTGR